MLPSLKAMRSIYPLTRGRMSTAPMAAIRPVNSSHWRTDLVTTWTASTSGGGDDGASAWLLLQAVITGAMTTMAMAERPARSDASKEWRCGTSVPLRADIEVEVNFNFNKFKGEILCRRSFVLLTILPPVRW